MKSEKYTPPYDITDIMIHLIAEISEQIGVISIKNETASHIPKLRRDNQIRSIHSSLAIENNTLSLEQVTDVINGKKVLGAPKEIREVKNAYEAYNILPHLNPYSLEDMLRAHKVLMEDLSAEAGKLRSGGVGVFAGERLVHMAPPARLVQHHMQNLINWAKSSDVHPLIKSCVFHYEFEFIHPFDDGNGRMGRMWQTLLLSDWKEVFIWIPVEDLVRERQQEYYDALASSDKAASSTVFVEFMLYVIRDSLSGILATEQVREQVTVQVEKLIEAIGTETLSARELMQRLGLTHRPTFAKNYINPALSLGLITMTVPEKPNSSKQRYKKRI